MGTVTGNFIMLFQHPSDVHKVQKTFIAYILCWTDVKNKPLLWAGSGTGSYNT